MSTKPFDPSKATHTPPEVANYGLEGVRRFRENKSRGIGLGIPGIDGYFAPVLPGQICAIIAQTSNYKSGFMHHVEHKAAQLLAEQGREDEILVHVSVEEVVEEQAYLEFSRYTGFGAGNIAIGDVQDWSLLEQAAVKVAGVPIYRIGDSLAHAELMQNLTLSNMVRAIRYLRDEALDWRPKIAGIFFDYLQAFPIDEENKAAGREAQRRMQVRSDIFRIRQASTYFDCPCFFCVQAKQQMTGANPPIMLPGVYDGEESSSIGQRSDRVLTMWMPKTTHSLGETIRRGPLEFKVEENDLFVKVAKQRGGLPAGKVWRCKVGFDSNSIKVDSGDDRHCDVKDV